MVKVVVVSLMGPVREVASASPSSGNNRRRVPVCRGALKRFKVLVLLLLVMVVVVVIVVGGTGRHACTGSVASCAVVQRVVDVVKVGHWRCRRLHLLRPLSTSFQGVGLRCRVVAVVVA